jgi:hypothetical protein
MYSDATSPVEIAERHETFKAELANALSTPVAPPGSPDAAFARELDNRMDQLSKSVDPSTIESVRHALQGDVAKDWTTSSPLSSGLVAFDLEPAAKILAPRPTPLRNRIARRRGQGLNHQFKRVLGYSGTKTGGAAGNLINPGISESTTNTFGPGNIAYARGPKIQYAADELVFPYCQFGLSDQVSFAAQFAGMGFDDIRNLSSTALLYASMLSEESMLLGGRGTKTGYSGALAAPTGLAGAVRAAASNEVGATGNVANLYVRVTSVGMWGESASSTELNFTGLASSGSGKVVDITFTDAPGALGYKVYVGSSTGAATCFAANISNSSAAINAAGLGAGATVPGQAVTIHFTGAGTSGVPNAGATAPIVDSSASVNNYDGVLTACTNASAGYVKRLNAPLSASGGAYANNIGGEFEDAFVALWDSVKADPDEILASGRDRKAVSDLLKTQSSSAFRIALTNDESHGTAVGSVINGLYNPVTGKAVDLTVHAWLPQGNMPIISWTLPVPDSNVGDTFAVVGPADLTQFQWPVTQYQYEASTWWMNTLVSYAPAWSGCIQGVFRA